MPDFIIQREDGPSEMYRVYVGERLVYEHIDKDELDEVINDLLDTTYR